MKKKSETMLYIIIFQTGIILAFLGILILQGMESETLTDRRINRNPDIGSLALMDNRTGEEIAFQMERDELDVSIRQYRVCLKNQEGRVLYLGVYDLARGILTGELLLSEEELSSFVIVNIQNHSTYPLSVNFTSIETGDYYITFHAGKVETQNGKISSYNLNIFYAPIYTSI